MILGQPVAQSLSPVFQNAALAAAGIPVEYTRREESAATLPSALAACAQTRTAGNVTMPHKRAVHDAAARLTDAARRAGAVNTFWWDGDELVGHNTDIDGIRATVHALCPRGIDGDVVLLGAGGSASAVLVALTTSHAPSGVVHVVARNTERALALVRTLAAHRDESTTVQVKLHSAFADIDWHRVALVINATPLGMRDDDPEPVPVAVLQAPCAVYDLVYKAAGTRWVHEARQRGLVAEDGLRMLVEQGASAFESWFGVEAPRGVMWQALGHMMPEADAPRIMAHEQAS